jgi:hypothetical protein
MQNVCEDGDQIFEENNDNNTRRKGSSAMQKGYRTLTKSAGDNSSTNKHADSTFKGMNMRTRQKRKRRQGNRTEAQQQVNTTETAIIRGKYTVLMTRAPPRHEHNL